MSDGIFCRLQRLLLIVERAVGEIPFSVMCIGRSRRSASGPRAQWPGDVVIPGAQQLRRRTLAMLRSHRTSFACVLMQMPLVLNPHGSHVNSGHHRPASDSKPRSARRLRGCRGHAANCFDFLQDARPARPPGFDDGMKQTCRADIRGIKNVGKSQTSYRSSPEAAGAP